MNEFDKNIIQFREDFPKKWSFLWSPEEASKIPLEHKDQIHFLKKKGTELINEYLYRSNMTKGLPFQPFQNHFKIIEMFRVSQNCDKEIKKWLYSKGIPFSKFVYVDSERSGQSVMLTWKMVVKYWEGMFFAHDLVIFDSSLTWGLFYYHDDRLYFGSGLIKKETLN